MKQTKAIALIMCLLLVLGILVSCDHNSVTKETVPTFKEPGSFKVYGEEYKTLAEAVKAVKGKSGSKDSSIPSILLLGDVEDAGAEIDTDVNLIFGSFEYTLKGSDKGIEVKPETSVSVQGGTFKAVNNTAESLFNSAGNLTLTNITVDLEDTSLDAIKTTAGETTIKGTSSIAVADDKNIFKASNSDVTVAENAKVKLKGTFALEDASIDLANSELSISVPFTNSGSSSIKKGDQTVDGSTSFTSPVISRQPDATKTLFFAAVDGTVLDVSCDVTNIPFVTYQWYSNTTKSIGGKLIEGATEKVLDYKIEDRGLDNYFYCVATNAWNGTTKTSNIVQVYYTGLPTVYVDLLDKDGNIITTYNAATHSPNDGTDKAKKDSVQRGIGTTAAEIETTGSKDVIVYTGNNQPKYNMVKETKFKNASVTISGAEEDEWNTQYTSVTFSGRGNSTWKDSDKKPFKLKLSSKMEVMGMPKHKNWVLLANYFDNTHMKNSLGFYLSKTLGLDYTVRGYHVDLVMNGVYMGLYWLGEQIKEGEYRVDIEDSDYLIELDFHYDEQWRFYSSIRNLPYMIKNVEDDDPNGAARRDWLNNQIASLESLLYPVNEVNEDYAEILDVNSFAKFFIVSKIIDNPSTNTPGSIFFTYKNEGTNENPKWVLRAGPLWDLDYSWLDNSHGVVTENTLYYNSLFHSPTFVNALKTIWSEYKSEIDIENFIDDLSDRIDVAQRLDASIWHPNNESAHSRVNSRSSFKDYVDNVRNKTLAKINVVNNLIDSLE